MSAPEQTKHLDVKVSYHIYTEVPLPLLNSETVIIEQRCYIENSFKSPETYFLYDLQPFISAFLCLPADVGFWCLFDGVTSMAIEPGVRLRDILDGKKSTNLYFNFFDQHSGHISVCVILS